jgi:DNA-binding IclR family transcriptional regulator
VKTPALPPSAPAVPRAPHASAASAGADRRGTQLLSRGVRVLRVLATRGEIGWRLSDLAATCGLDKATAHRILACLVEERLVQQRPQDRRYLPGPLVFELGLSLPGQHRFCERAERRLGPFADRMKALSCLLLRSGYEYVCSVRAGSTPLAGMLVYPGTRRPLFTSVGGLAILQTLSRDEAQDVLHNNIGQEVVKRGTARLQALQAMRERSKRHGFGVNIGDVAPGVHSFAVPVRAPGGEAFAAVCLMGTSEVLHEGRVAELRRELDAIAALLEEDLVELVFHGVRAAEP